MTDKDRIKKLELILRQALGDHGDELHPWSCSSADVMVELPDGTFDVAPSKEDCDCWIREAREALAETKRPEPVVNDECSCRHTYLRHAKGGGLCCFAGCDCMKFKE